MVVVEDVFRKSSVIHSFTLVNPILFVFGAHSGDGDLLVIHVRGRTVKPTLFTLYSIYLELRASTYFEHYLLILRRRYTNGTWYIICALCKLATPELMWNVGFTILIYCDAWSTKHSVKHVRVFMYMDDLWSYKNSVRLLVCVDDYYCHIIRNF
jgi:hypothetical protein